MVADLTAARGVAEAEVPPELLAQSLRQYLRAWWLRVRSGDSGILPVVLARVALILRGPGLVSRGNSRYTNEVVLYDIFWGRFEPVVGWILLAVVVGATGTGLWLRDARKRRHGLETPPRSLTAMKIVLMAVVGIAVVAICNVNRAHSGTIEGVPYIIPIVLV